MMIAATCLGIAITRVLVTSDCDQCRVRFDVSESKDAWLIHEREGVWRLMKTLAAVVSFGRGEPCRRVVIGPSLSTLWIPDSICQNHQSRTILYQTPLSLLCPGTLLHMRNRFSPCALDQARAFLLQYLKLISIEASCLL